MLTVSLVGYTNAGKSTLMRALTGADVYVADKAVRNARHPHPQVVAAAFGDVLLSDTVGFIRNLPHHLVASFRSTLEEARHADLLLHVVDASHPEAQRQLTTVMEVLGEIGVDQREPAAGAEQNRRCRGPFIPGCAASPLPECRGCQCPRPHRFETLARANRPAPGRRV